MTICAAIDLGASGGRLMLGEYNGERLKLSEIHRFPNDPVTLNGVLYWDFPRLFHEIKEGFRKIANEKIKLDGIGIDTWGVDYGLLDRRGQLLGLPVHYRDERTEPYLSIPEMNPEEIYSRTGIQHMPFNTLYQLRAEAAMRPDVLETATDLLFMPDLFTYFLTGKKINEYTIASTSQLLNAREKGWDREIMRRILPAKIGNILKPLTKPCEVIGPLRKDILAETGLDESVRLIAAGSHDTASAVAGTPLDGENSAYLSCGTWSLMGVELDEPNLSPQSFGLNFTNEGGLDGKIRYLRNINGLYIIQELLKSHNKNAAVKLDYASLSRAAEESKKPFKINPQDASFNNPPDMARAVAENCLKNNQTAPESIGELAIAVYNGLVAEYAAVLGDISQMLNKPIDTLHMVGGGIKDEFLCRKTAEATKRKVVAGPVEASALGNITAQLIGLKKVKDLREGREIIRRSFEPTVYE
jgi:rhamnulokinase